MPKPLPQRRFSPHRTERRWLPQSLAGPASSLRSAVPLSHRVCRTRGRSIPMPKLCPDTRRPARKRRSFPSSARPQPRGRSKGAAKPGPCHWREPALRTDPPFASTDHDRGNRRQRHGDATSQFPSCCFCSIGCSGFVDCMCMQKRYFGERRVLHLIVRHNRVRNLLNKICTEGALSPVMEKKRLRQARTTTRGCHDPELEARSWSRHRRGCYLPFQHQQHLSIFPL